MLRYRHDGQEGKAMKRMYYVIYLLLIIAALIIGRMEGTRHALEDSIMYAVECYNPSCPEESAWNGYDLRIFIDLDGRIYEHGVYQG